MSLINDALKRAKLAQQQAPPSSSGPQLRPAEPTPSTRHGAGLALSVAFAGLALLVLLMVWRISRNVNSVKEASARTQLAQVEPDTDTAATASAAQKRPEPGAVPAVSAGLPPANPELGPKRPSGTAAHSTNAPETTTSPATASAPEASTNSLVVTEPPAPQPAPLKLQGIIYNPNRPSAVINGKTLFLGEHLGEFKVVAINQNSAKLVGGGQTNVLNLPE